MSAPQIMGHEIAGRSSRSARRCFDFAVGDRVQVIAAIPDGTCTECPPRAPPGVRAPGVDGVPVPGGFAEYLIVPEVVLRVGGLNRIPDGLGFAEASLAEPLACVLNGQELAQVGTGDTVVVIGRGADRMPSTCVSRAPAAPGRSSSSISTPIGHRSRRPSVHPDATIAGGDPVDAACSPRPTAAAPTSLITAAASGAAQEQGLRMLARRGRPQPVRRPPERPPHDHRRREPRALPQSSRSSASTAGRAPSRTRRALDLIASGAVPVADLITHRLPLDRVLDAIDIVARRSHQSDHRAVGVHMPERTVTVASSVGLHARARVAAAAQAAAKAGCRSR